MFLSRSTVRKCGCLKATVRSRGHGNVPCSSPTPRSSSKVAVTSLSDNVASSSKLPPQLKATLAQARQRQSELYETSVYGWVRSFRKQKNVTFAVVNDGSTSENLQIVIPKGMDTGLSVGSSVAMKGAMVDSPGSGQDKEFQITSLEILGESDASTYPIQKQKDGQPAPFLRRNAHLRPRGETTSAMLRLRDEMTWATNLYFRENGFINVQTPIITSSDCEGAGEVFRVETSTPVSKSTTNDIIMPLSKKLSPEAGAKLEKTVPSPKYLTVSAQLHLEALAASLGRVYTLSPTFRAEKSDTARHLQEFWMLEAESSFLSTSETEALEQVMETVEGVIKAVIRHVLNYKALENHSTSKATSSTVEQELRSMVRPEPYTRMTYTSAVETLRRHSTSSSPDVQFRFEPKWGNPLQTEHEKWLAEHYVKGPVFVTNYPIHLKPFYMLPNSCSEEGGEGKSSDSSSGGTERGTSACFDLLVPRLGELAGGSLREHRLEQLVKAMEKHGIISSQYEWYLDLRRYGSTRHGGFGLGWERLVSFITGLDNVRDCIAFPRATEGSRF